jgi:hypothetical protein
MRDPPALSRSQRDRVRKATKKSGAEMRALAKEQKISINELYDQLIKAPSPASDSWVDAEFVWWSKVKPEWVIHKDQRRKTIGGR